MGAKKAANLFRIYCFVCRCGAAGSSVFMLSVQPELEQAFNQLCSNVVLLIRIIIAVHFGERRDVHSRFIQGIYAVIDRYIPHVMLWEENFQI